MDVRGVVTNTVPIDAYRAPASRSHYMIERLIDEAARRCGFDPIALRRRNLVTQFPYRKASAQSSIAAALLKTSTPPSARRIAPALPPAAPSRLHRQTPRHRRDLLMETARGAPNEGAEIRSSPTERCVLIGTQSNAWATRPRIHRSPPTCSACRSMRFATSSRHRFVRDGNGHGAPLDASGRRGAVQGRGHDAGQRHRIAARLLQASPAQVQFIADHS